MRYGYLLCPVFCLHSFTTALELSLPSTSPWMTNTNMHKKHPRLEHALALIKLSRPAVAHQFQPYLTQFPPPHRPGRDDGTPIHGSPILIILMGRSLAAASSHRALFLAASLRSTPNSFTLFPSSPPRSSWLTIARRGAASSPAPARTSSCMSSPRSSCRTSRKRERKPRSSSQCRRACASSVDSVRLSFLSCSFSLVRSSVRGGDDADEELRSLPAPPAPPPPDVVTDAGGGRGNGGGNAVFTTLPPPYLDGCGVVDLRRRMPDRRPCSPRRKFSFANSHRSGTTFRKPCMDCRHRRKWKCGMQIHAKKKQRQK
jgi:hypothetical protein